MLDIAAACIVVAALLAYLNHRFVRMPTTIGVMVVALVLSLVIVGLDIIGKPSPEPQHRAAFFGSAQFQRTPVARCLCVAQRRHGLVHQATAGHLANHRQQAAPAPFMGR